MSLLAELKRRNVHRMAGLYLVAAWLAVQVCSTVFPAFDLPSWVLRAVIVALAVGFVPALAFAWAFEWPPEGLKRDVEVVRSDASAARAGRRMDRVLLVAFAVALGYFAFDKFVLAPHRERAQAEAARREGRAEGLARSYGDKSIAVLPFADLSPARDQAYFSDGIAEELLNLLAQLPQLRVISRASAFSFKGKDVPLPEIARQLNVEHVLEGSVRKSGNRVRITAQLVEATADTQLWSQSWDRELDDVFAVQDEIAAAVVDQLRVKLLGAAPTVQKVDPHAYTLFLQARELSNRTTADGYREAEKLLEQSLAVAPDYAPACVTRAVNFLRSVNAGIVPRAEGYARAREALDRAIALDPHYGQAYAQSGWLRIYQDNDLASAARDIEQALALAPTDDVVIGRAAALLYNLGRLDEAIAFGEYEVSRNPLSVAGFSNLGIRYLTAHRYDEAVDSFRTMLRLSPDSYSGEAMLAQALLFQGDANAAMAAAQREHSDLDRLLTLAMVHHALGHRVEADRALQEAIDRFGSELPLEIAATLAYSGEIDRAFQWLDKAIGVEEAGIAESVLYPFFDNLHEDPRWLLILRKLGRAPEQLAKVHFDARLPQGTAVAESSAHSPR
jgi:TolB-like protein/Tfp pilus assembly protein PilF